MFFFLRFGGVGVLRSHTCSSLISTQGGPDAQSNIIWSTFWIRLTCRVRTLCEAGCASWMDQPLCSQASQPGCNTKADHTLRREFYLLDFSCFCQTEMSLFPACLKLTKKWHVVTFWFGACWPFRLNHTIGSSDFKAF